MYLDFVARTLAKTMAHPKIGYERLVKRECVGISGADHVISCKSTRRSNSGCWVFRSRHLLHHWYRVRARGALSTGEEE